MAAKKKTTAVPEDSGESRTTLILVAILAISLLGTFLILGRFAQTPVIGAPAPQIAPAASTVAPPATSP